MDISSIKQPIFGSWYIEEEIGSGSFGTVFKIRQETPEKTYYSALKVIRVPQNDGDIQSVRSELGDDDSVRAYYDNFVQNFFKEIEVMSELKGYKNIVGIEDHDYIANDDGFGGTILIRMELLTPFTSYLGTQTMQQTDVLRLGIDICSALEICEQKKIIHRDIKPDNIFVAEDGSFKLGDFGIARELEKTMGGLSKKGTYNYMAPEVYLDKPYNQSVDTYSLGIVLYKLLNHNRAPFMPPAPEPITYTVREAAIRHRMNGEKLPVIESIPDSLNAIVQKACAFDPNNRYSSASEMKAALSDYLTTCLSPDKKASDAPESDVADMTYSDTATEIMNRSASATQITDQTVVPNESTATAGSPSVLTQQEKQPIAQENDPEPECPPSEEIKPKKKNIPFDTIIIIALIIVVIFFLALGIYFVNIENSFLKSENTPAADVNDSYDNTTKAKYSSDNTTTTKKADSLVIDKQHLENLIGMPIDDIQAVWPADRVEDVNYSSYNQYYYYDIQSIYIYTVDGIVDYIIICFYGESSYSLFGISVDDSVSQALATIKEYGYTEDLYSSDEYDSYHYRNPDSDSEVYIEFRSDGSLEYLSIWD